MIHEKLISQMTLEEKASLLSGLDMWHTKRITRLNIDSIMMCDGPHGLRKQNISDIGDINQSEKATCFPPACLAACSWDTDLIERMGDAIAKEALKEKVSIILGPGANIKRSPLCGRNFEYYSEDPYLAGKLAAAFIKGAEKNGIATSLKHFAANNQETMRMLVSSEVDERALREIYLKPFEIAVKEGKPSTLMCAYNKLNGTYCSENKRLLTNILRDEWGFDGVVMSDWGAVNIRPKGVEAGLDLEMPSSGGYGDRKIVEAVQNGSLDQSCLDTAVDRMLTLIDKAQPALQNKHSYSIAEHLDIATNIALKSIVLLKNSGILPLNPKEKILVIGALATNPRYQGAGSSHINPHELISLTDALTAANIAYEYKAGYSLKKNKSSKKLIKDALTAAKNYDKIIVCAGLPDEYESEGFDRKTMELPASQNELIQGLLDSGAKIAVSLSCGSPVELPWADKADAILLSYLAGSGGGKAIADILYGKANPSGKLAESWPYKLSDTPCYHDFIYDSKASFYTESIYVGYRYYLSADVKPLFPFGHGLSYTSYEYSELETEKIGDQIKMFFNLTNTGKMDGEEITQIYSSKTGGKVFSPELELKEFVKTYLKAGETKRIEISLPISAFSYYDSAAKAWLIESADYTIGIAASSQDIKLKSVIHIDKDTPQVRYPDSWYTAPNGNKIPFDDYLNLLGKEIDLTRPTVKKGNFNIDMTLDEMKESFLARTILSVSKKAIRLVIRKPKDDPTYIMAYEMFSCTPLRKLASVSQGAFTDAQANGLLMMLNGHFFKGLGKIIKNK